MSSYGPVAQLYPSPGPVQYLGLTVMETWHPQTTFGCRQWYNFNPAGQHGAMSSPFPGHLANGSQRQFQHQPMYSNTWTDSRYVPRTFNETARPRHQPQVPAQVPTQAPPAASVPDAPRGPPRKPKQSGHAVWIGNLPVGTSIHDFKDYSAQGATNEIESIFLISKSNCAFANYNSHSACQAAILRIQNSSFQGRRLVCRLRMHSIPPPSLSTSSEPTESSSCTASSASTASSVTPPPTRPLSGSDTPLIVQSHSPKNLMSSPELKQDLPVKILEKPEVAVKIPERYFIIKSLTVQDLVASVNNGTWEPQAHNEDLLQNAFRNAVNVYLIFSANKSGEYFGLARMTSDMYSKAVEEKTSTLIGGDRVPAKDEPRSIITPATDSAPSGRIHDDSTRGTIFWEADRSVFDNTSKPEEKPALSKQFNIEWLSTSRVPFFRLRGLRNPWNGLKEVKIARDGTELEPNVGRIVAHSFRSS